MASSAATPPRAGAPARLEVLDALRGAALLGVLLANLRAFSLHDFLPAAAGAGPADIAAQWLMAALVDAKAATLFALLFGVGFALQLGPAPLAPGRRRRHALRLLALLAIGLLHAWLLWWGDILRYYALLGLLMLPLAGWSARRLAIVGAALALFAWPLLLPWARLALPPQVPSAQATAAALSAFSAPDLMRAWAANLDYDLRMRIANWSLLIFVLGRLMIGAALGRAGLFLDPAAHLAAWRRLAGAALLVGVPASAFVLLRDGAILFADGWWSGGPGRDLARIVRSAASLALGLGYMAGFVLLFQWPRARRLLAGFAPVGRMALTNYLGQSLLAISLFYGVGLGLGPVASLPRILALGVLLFIVQALASAWWLRRYALGPCEWLWRSAAAGRWQAMRLPASQPRPAQAAGSPGNTRSST
ncbi:DUF418 domain-containing protein [Achromobacter insuavis]|mgnify:CR=1 FL=1|uniref:DUF418 domain-containing protein n=1 Tax=Achromobacter insuavis TaxID=1287735 RepID=UPI001465E994|nr:DUF418 domain-containing protein [Achromobacter insuavis]CAB3849275.1 hypothetical protein LMG26846_01902 [Achromobacter insuavis]